MTPRESKPAAWPAAPPLAPSASYQPDVPPEWAAWFEGLRLWRTAILRMIVVAVGLLISFLTAWLVWGRIPPLPPFGRQPIGVLPVAVFVIPATALLVWMMSAFQRGTWLMAAVPPASGDRDAITVGAFWTNLAGIVGIAMPVLGGTVLVLYGEKAMGTTAAVCGAAVALCWDLGMPRLVRATGHVATELGFHPAARELHSARKVFIAGAILVPAGVVLALLQSQVFGRTGFDAVTGCLGIPAFHGIALCVAGMAFVLGGYVYLESGLRKFIHRDSDDDRDPGPPAYRVGSGDGPA